MKIRTTLTTMALTLAIGTVATACGASPSGSAGADPDATTSTDTVVDTPSVWVVIDGETAEQYPVSAKPDGSYRYDARVATDPDNLVAARAAQTVIEQYLAAAWVAPYRQNITDREALAGWTQMLVDPLDPRWLDGPTWIDVNATDPIRPSGDLRSAHWAGNPSAAPDAQWNSNVSYEYQIAKYYGRVSNERAAYPQVFIERSPDGELRGVYLPWAVETGYSADVPGKGRMRLVNVDFGVAQMVPAKGSESALVLLTPDFSGRLRGVMTGSGYVSFDNSNGEFSEAYPRAVRDIGVNMTPTGP